MTESSGGDDTASREPEVPADRFAVRIMVTPRSITELLQRFPLDVGDRPHVVPGPGEAGTLYAFAPEDQIQELRDAGYSVDVGENVSEVGRERMAEVAEGDRFEGGRFAPTGLGVKSGRNPGQRPAG